MRRGKSRKAHFPELVKTDCVWVPTLVIRSFRDAFLFLFVLYVSPCLVPTLVSAPFVMCFCSSLSCTSLLKIERGSCSGPWSVQKACCRPQMFVLVFHLQKMNNCYIPYCNSTISPCPCPPEVKCFNPLWVIIPLALFLILVVFCDDYQTE